MMMYGDSAIEEELEDLGDEFAAECAADSSVPGVSGTSSGGGPSIHQVYYSSSASSSSHSLVDHQQHQPQIQQHFYDPGHHQVQQPQNSYEHRYAQVLEPQVQQQFHEANYVPTTHAQPSISQEFHQPVIRQQHQPVIQQKYQQVHQPMSMYSNGGIYAPPQQPQQHVYQQIETPQPVIHQVKEPVIQQVFEPVTAPPTGIDPSMMPRGRINHLPMLPTLPVPAIPPLRIQRAALVRSQQYHQMSSSVAQQQPQIPQNLPEGVRQLRHRVVGRPVPTTTVAPVSPVTPVVTSSVVSDPLPPSTVAPTPVTSAAETVMKMVVSQQQLANGRSGAAQATTRNTLPTIPKKKKATDTTTTAPIGAIASTEIAQAGAIQRIGTEEGWKQMNAWLKNADKEQKVAHLKDLLKQCLQASISVALLTSNETPKFVRKLSKTHSDPEIKSLSAQCVAKWKKEIAAPSVPAPVKKTKKAVTKDTVVEEEAQKDVEMESVTTPTKSEAKKPEKRRLSDENDKSKGASSEKPKIKAKAKVFTAKSRLTGLVQDLGSGDAQPPEAKKAKKEDEVAGNKTKKDTVAANPTSTAVKKLPPIPKKVSAATMSSGFMDALAVNTEAKKKPLPKKKAPVEQKKGPIVIDAQHDPLASVLDSMGGDLMRKVEPPRRLKTPTPPPAVVIPDDPAASPPGRRKIRFADECGQELFFIKEFEIEEGERINVNRMSAEDMKHHEMMMERKWKEDSGEKKIEDDEDEATTPAVPEVTWRLLPIENLSCTIVHGANSLEKEIEAKRRETALRAFNHPNFPSEIMGDPEDNDPVAARMHIPTTIPLVSAEDPEATASQEPAPAPAPAPVVEEKKIALPDNLKNLLDGLKKKGIVSDGPGPAASVAASTATTMSSLVPGLSSLGIFNNAATPSVSMIQQQQQAPPQMPPPQQGMYQHPPQIQQGYGPQYGQQQQPQYQQGMPPPHQQHQHQHHQQYPPMDMGRDRPMAGPSGGPRGPPNPQVCHMFVREGRCRFGNRCRFSHDNVPGNFRDDRRNDRGDWGRGRGRGGRGGGGDDRWRGGDERRGGPYRKGPRRDWRDERDRRKFDGASPPYQSPPMHSPSIRSPPVDGTPSEFPDAVAIPSERVD